MAESHQDACEVCGHVIQIGEFPLGCKGDPSRHGRWFGAERPISSEVDEMISDTPREFTSIREKVRYMDRHNLVPSREAVHRDPHVGLRSSDIRHAIRETIQEFRR